MKHLKRFMALFAALALVLAMAAPAFADEPTTGSITINKATAGTTYTAYKIFDLDYVKETTTTKASYAYTADTNWKAFVTSSGAGAAYVDYNEKTGAVTAKNTFDEEQAPAFAKAALAYAKDNSKITGVTATADTSGKVEFTGLALGYYVVDTPMGALCVLDSTAPSVTVNEKNEVPSVEKQVKAGSSYAATNTAKIGDTVEFETKINVKKGAANYVLHDKMDAGLTLNTSSIKVFVDGAEVTASKTTYAVKTEQSDKKDSDCTFEIVFADTYVAGLAGKTIVVTYNATLNSKAVVGGAGNKNDTYLKYGNDNDTTHGKTTTYTYEFDIVKTNDADQLLEGAVFSLYASEDAPTPMNLVAVSTGVYRLPTKDDATATVTTFTAGKVTIQGLANGDYYLEEITAPKGYNKLDHREKITINNANLKANTTENTYTDGGVKVENKAGTTLPGTGGIGTTIFYLIGGGLMVAAAVLLIAKKRMENK